MVLEFVVGIFFLLRLERKEKRNGGEVNVSSKCPYTVVYILTRQTTPKFEWWGNDGRHLLSKNRVNKKKKG